MTSHLVVYSNYVSILHSFWDIVGYLTLNNSIMLACALLYILASS